MSPQPPSSPRFRAAAARRLRGLCMALLAGSCALAAAAPAQSPDTALLESAIAAAAAGDTDRARELARQAAQACADEAQPETCELATHVLLSRNFSLAAAYDLAFAEAREAARLVKNASPESRLPTLLILAGAAARAGELGEAERAIADGQRIAEQLADGATGKAADDMRRLRGMFGGPQALVFSARGEHVRAAAAQKSLVETMRSFDPEHRGLPAELLTLAGMQEEAADPAGAQATYEEAIGLAEKIGDADALAAAKAGLAWLEASKPQ